VACIILKLRKNGIWAGLYNTPLITGKLDPFDVLFFGLAYTFVYSKTRNSVGFVTAYQLNENPLWWVVANVFPNLDAAFTFALIVRVPISSVTLAIEMMKNVRNSTSNFSVDR